MFPGFRAAAPFYLKNSTWWYQVRYVPHFTPLEWAYMSEMAAKFDTQRISAAMNGHTCRKRRPNLTCTRFSESGQRTQVYWLLPSISPCQRRHRGERSAGRLPPCVVGSGNTIESSCIPWVLAWENSSESVIETNPDNKSESHEVRRGGRSHPQAHNMAARGKFGLRKEE